MGTAIFFFTSRARNWSLYGRRGIQNWEIACMAGWEFSNDDGHDDFLMSKLHQLW